MSFPLELYRNAREMPPRIPQPSRRHGAPCGPWPFLDLDSEIDPEQLANPQQALHERQTNPDWSQAHQIPSFPVHLIDRSDQYPQSLYPNWTASQQQKSGITRVINHVSREPCTIHRVTVSDNGIFAAEEAQEVTEDNKAEYWKELEAVDQRLNGLRVRALFVHNLSGPVLQIYNVEPFFFSSSLNWIPSRYQEAVGEGDHITLTLTFIRCMQDPTTVPSSPTSSIYAPTVPTLQSADQVIDTQAPLILSSSNLILAPDILAIHMVRSPKLSTIISYHPPHTYHRTTTAYTLKTRLLAAGQSVYWNKIFASTISSDPTFVLLALLWYPIYALDESLEALYLHICWLESRVMATTDMTLTQQLHVVRAHLLHYASLLEDFRRTVLFVAQTPNPVLERVSDSHSAEAIGSATELMRRESTNLLNEIARLEQSRSMQDSRLKNVMNLAFSSVNLEDSRRMQKLTEAAVRDSAAMKQISYLTMVFLPASFAAAVFGMNLKEIAPGTNGTIPHYLALTLPLTAVTIWVIMAFQYRKKDPNKLIEDHDEETETSVWSRLNWPVVSLRKFRRTSTSKAATFSRPSSAHMSRPASMRNRDAHFA